MKKLSRYQKKTGIQFWLIFLLMSSEAYKWFSLLFIFFSILPNSITFHAFAFLLNWLLALLHDFGENKRKKTLKIFQSFSNEYGRKFLCYLHSNKLSLFTWILVKNKGPTKRPELNALWVTGLLNWSLALLYDFEIQSDLVKRSQWKSSNICFLKKDCNSSAQFIWH